MRTGNHPPRTAAGASWSIVLGGGGAVAWTVAGGAGGFAASWVGWAVAPPVLVVLSPATRHGPEEDLELCREEAQEEYGGKNAGSDTALLMVDESRPA